MKDTRVHIQMLAPVSSTAPISHTAMQLLYPQKGLRGWWHRLLARLLDLSGASMSVLTTEIHYVDFDSRHFMDAMFKLDDDFATALTYHPSTLVIGRLTFNEVMRDLAMSKDIGFEFAAEYGLKKTIMGLSVHVVPWARGWVVF